MGPIYREPPVYKPEPRREVPVLGDSELGGIHSIDRSSIFFLTARDIEHRPEKPNATNQLKKGNMSCK